MHVMDLAVTQDVILSALLLWSEKVPGKGRQKLLDELREDYNNWCAAAKFPDRASYKLFHVKTLVPKTGCYPEVSSKVLKAAAARAMVPWCAEQARKRAEIEMTSESWCLVLFF